jgi:hypothetical protein
VSQRGWTSSEVSRARPFCQHTLDGLLERYVAWREESRTVWLAYEQWCQAERPIRSLAYAAYGAALDREERAASAQARRPRFDELEALIDFICPRC